MPETLREMMTSPPTVLDASASVEDAARAMRSNDIGDVIVIDDDAIRGILTDRDIVLRVVAAGKVPLATQVGEVCSDDVVTLPPDAPVEQAIDAVRSSAIRRIPVVEDGRPVGVVSLGDLAVDLDRRSALGDVSAAPPNN
jgi:CBS domain-containing protein